MAKKTKSRARKRQSAPSIPSAPAPLDMRRQYRLERAELRSLKRNIARGRKEAAKNYQRELRDAARVLDRINKGLDGEEGSVQKRMLVLEGRLS